MGKVLGKKRNKILLLAVVAVVLLVIIVSNISRLTKAQELPTVNVAAVETGDVQEKVDTSGTVVSQNKKTFFSPVNAQIESLNLTVGDSVSAGTQLVGFDLDDLEQQNQVAELNALSAHYTSTDTIGKSNTTAADKAQAESDVNTLESQVEGKKNEITDIQNQIAAAVGQAAEAAAEELAGQLAALNKQLEKAKTQQAKLQEKYDKAETAKSVAETKMQQDGSEENVKEFEAAAAAFSKVSQALSEAVAATDSIQGQINSLNADTGSVTDTSGLETQLANAQGELSELQAKLSSAQAVADSAGAAILSSAAKSQLKVSENLAELEVKSIEELIEEGKKGIQAEFTGVVTNAVIAEGAVVTQGMELFTLESTEDVNVNITISKYDLEKVKEGQSARITIAGSEYKGTLVRINKMATTNETGTTVLEAEVHIDNPDENIYLGVDAKVVVEGTKAADVLLVPSEVINVGKDGAFCYIVENGFVVKKEVETGIASDNYTEITAGLKEGDLVVTDSVDAFEEGQKAEPLQAGDDQAEEQDKSETKGKDETKDEDAAKDEAE